MIPSNTVFLLFLSHIFGPFAFRKSSSLIFIKFLTVPLFSRGIKTFNSHNIRSPGLGNGKGSILKIWRLTYNPVFKYMCMATVMPYLFRFIANISVIWSSDLFAQQSYCRIFCDQLFHPDLSSSTVISKWGLTSYIKNSFYQSKCMNLHFILHHP